MQCARFWAFIMLSVLHPSIVGADTSAKHIRDPEAFPTTREFSAFARKHAEGLDALKDPDSTLLGWMEFEERLFMTLERHIVSKRLDQGFAHKDGAADVDAFVKFSLSVQNRRKARAGWALGNHIDAILKAHKLAFKREATTEKRNGPDFLFPGEEEYQDAGFPSDRLLMLGAKTTCKDRWRQVLAEADRISPKHLLTLEAGISPVQTDEMHRSGLALVIPTSIQESYKPAQQLRRLPRTGPCERVTSDLTGARLVLESHRTGPGLRQKTSPGL
jgi:hypothetical protein